MQVGEQDLVRSQHGALHGLRLFDLDNHIRPLKNLGRATENLGTGTLLVALFDPKAGNTARLLREAGITREQARETLKALQRANADGALTFFLELRADTVTEADAAPWHQPQQQIYVLRCH